MAVMVTGNMIIFSDKTPDSFNNYWAMCGRPAMLYDGKREFFIFSGFAVFFEKSI